MNTVESRGTIEFNTGLPAVFAKVFLEDYDCTDEVAKIVRRDDLILMSQKTVCLKD
jgi:hypothetical protein